MSCIAIHPTQPGTYAVGSYSCQGEWSAPVTHIYPFPLPYSWTVLSAHARSSVLANWSRWRSHSHAVLIRWQPTLYRISQGSLVQRSLVLNDYIMFCLICFRALSCKCGTCATLVTSWCSWTERSTLTREYTLTCTGKYSYIIIVTSDMTVTMHFVHSSNQTILWPYAEMSTC